MILDHLRSQREFASGFYQQDGGSSTTYDVSTPGTGLLAYLSEDAGDYETTHFELDIPRTISYVPPGIDSTDSC